NHGAAYVEVDAVLSADHVVFTLHNVIAADHFFGDAAPTQPLNTLPFDDIARYRTGRTGQGQLTTLSETLAYVAAAAPTPPPATCPWAINIEIKGVLDSRQPYDGAALVKAIVRAVKESPLD